MNNNSEVPICLFVTYVFLLFLAFIPMRWYEVPGTPIAHPGAIPSVLRGIIAQAEASNIDPHHLLAISAQESSLGKFLVGDGGCSLGWFQANICANPEAKENIGDVHKEATWTINKLLQYGYADNPRLAIARYNRPNRPNFAYADRVLGPRLQEVRELTK